MGQYLPIVVLLALAALFGAGSFIASGLLAPRSPNDRKSAPYECGIIPSKETPERFPVRFFLVAMIFIVFDIEIIFFYPWAVSNGAVEWGPVKRVNEGTPLRSAERTSTTTIRRVGLEGRHPVRAGDGSGEE